MNTRVNVTKRVKLLGRDGYHPVMLSANGRIRPGWVVVKGREQRHTEGSYYLDWTEGGKRKRISVGKDPAQAYARKLNEQARLNALGHGIELVPETPVIAGRSLAATITTFLEETRQGKKPSTYTSYQTTLGYFAESCTKDYLEEIDRGTMLAFTAFLRDKGLSPRTAWNHFNVVILFLKAYGIRSIVTKNDWPKFVQEEPEVYEKEEMNKLFAACQPNERLLFEFYLNTGMREKEATYTTWSDVNIDRRIVTVRWKQEYGWTPKGYKEREIPIPAKLCDALRAARVKAKGCPLVFHTGACLPRRGSLHVLKKVAKRAGMDANGFWLHKFRATFATWSLWGGVDLATVQQWLGHSDMKSTMRYLKPSRSQATRDKVDAIFA